jgi:hypothetical protein
MPERDEATRPDRGSRSTADHAAVRQSSMTPAMAMSDRRPVTGRLVQLASMIRSGAPIAAQSRVFGGAAGVVQRVVAAHLAKGRLVFIDSGNIPANIESEDEKHGGYKLAGYGDRIFKYDELSLNYRELKFGEAGPGGRPLSKWDRMARANYEIRSISGEDQKSDLPGSIWSEKPLGGGSPARQSDFKEAPVILPGGQGPMAAGAAARIAWAAFETIVSRHLLDEANGRMALLEMYTTAYELGYWLQMPAHDLYAVTLAPDAHESPNKTAQAAWKTYGLSVITPHMQPKGTAKRGQMPFHLTKRYKELIGQLGALPGWRKEAVPEKGDDRSGRKKMTKYKSDVVKANKAIRAAVTAVATEAKKADKSESKAVGGSAAAVGTAHAPTKTTAVAADKNAD